MVEHKTCTQRASTRPARDRSSWRCFQGWSLGQNEGSVAPNTNQAVLIPGEKAVWQDKEQARKGRQQGGCQGSLAQGQSPIPRQEEPVGGCLGSKVKQRQPPPKTTAHVPVAFTAEEPANSGKPVNLQVLPWQAGEGQTLNFHPLARQRPMLVTGRHTACWKLPMMTLGP